MPTTWQQGYQKNLFVLALDDELESLPRPNGEKSLGVEPENFLKVS
jgi:hypothetical protein